MNKKHVLASVIGALLIGVAGASFAKDATITFKGSIDATTCTVTGGTGTNAAVDNFTVDLPAANIAELEAKNEVARTTQFTIVLAGDTCADGKTVQTKFDSAHANVTAAGNLKNTAAAAGAAKNVDLQLLNDKGAVINLKDNTVVSSAKIAGKTATLTHSVQYLATNKATSGAVESSVVYSITYN
jgi:major type 1 subunit fimbrin (pilin)